MASMTQEEIDAAVADFPHQAVLGGRRPERTETGLVMRVFWCTFTRDAGQWICEAIDDDGQKLGLRVVADTPRQSYERLINYWSTANGGGLSEFMSWLKPQMDAELDAAGL